ncbi:hypothetical protein IWQ62_003355, partial [Dispira parvispora]
MRFFPATYKFIDNAISKGGIVLVHSGMGKSRGPTIVIAYLMQRLKLGWEEARLLIMKKRPGILPNIEFQEQLNQFQRSIIQNLSPVKKDEPHSPAKLIYGTMVKMIPYVWENGKE